jgi:NADH:ubiquinone oxidoreductase subunit K
LAEVFALYIIAIAGAESAIGLAIIIAYFKIRKLN